MDGSADIKEINSFNLKKRNKDNLYPKNWRQTCKSRRKV